MFDQVKRYCGMSDWEVDLVPDDNPLAETSPVSAAMIAPQKHALGTFAVAGSRIQISYVPSLLQRPDRLIATFAHELAHYLLATAAETPPCAEDEIEFLTDLAAVYLGLESFLQTPASSSRSSTTVRCRDGGWGIPAICPKPT